MTRDELKIGDRVINAIDEAGTVVEQTGEDPFGYAKAGYVAVHLDRMTDEAEYFMHDPHWLRKEPAKNEA